ncbi:MAG: hypothetical protein ACFB10_23750, partial [Salibacteraceae bacterium]
QTQPGWVLHGRNLLTLDLTCSTNGQGLNAGYYYLEVENQKGEVLYLRFRQLTSYVCNQTGAGSGLSQ